MQICSKRKPTKLEIKCSLILGVVDVDALEVFLEHLQLAQAAVGEAPVGQHRQHGGEETQAGGAGIAARIGGEEGGYHHVGRVLAHTAVGCNLSSISTDLTCTCGFCEMSDTHPFVAMLIKSRFYTIKQIGIAIFKESS